MRLDTTTAVSTPERVRFRYHVAGPGRRAIAWVVDALLQTLILMVLGGVVVGLSQLGLGSFGMGGLLVGVFLLQWFYGAFFETVTAGRTPGKRLLTLRVVTDEGAPALPRQFMLRNLLSGADFLPMMFGVGVIVMASDSRLRRIGDRVAGTVVVDESKARVQGAIEIDPPVSEEERRGLPARIQLTRQEVRTIEDLLRRAPRMPPGRVLELASILAEPLQEQLGIEASDPLRVLVLAYARSTGRDRALA